MMLIVALLLLALLGAEADVSLVYTERGDINLGGLFPLHLYDESVQDCGALRGLDALKRVEAMAYTVRAINANNSVLPNITLGYEIYDTCSYNAKALQQSLKMIPAQRIPSDCTANDTMEPQPKIAGVVGAQRSASSLQAAILLGLYAIPQVSYLSTSDDLSNDDRYPYFLRTVPPDGFQVNAMVDLLLKYQWKYVSFINSDDTYGKSAQNHFRTRAAEHDICLAVVRTIPASVDRYDEVIDDLLSTQSGSAHSTVVILFVQLETAKDIFKAAAKAGAYRRFIWIGSDGWGNYGLEPVHGNEEVALGAFTVVPLSGQLQEYNNYLKSLDSATSTNPWLNEFMRNYGRCTANGTVDGNQVCVSWTLDDVPEVDEPAHETIVMDSVLAFAYGLHDMQRALCGNLSEGLCGAMLNANGTTLRDALLEVEFESPVNGHVAFMENGDIGGRYGIRNLQLVDGEYAFLDVGTWVDSAGDDKLLISVEIPWYLPGNSTLYNEETKVPQSVCSTPCDVGEKRTVLPENPCCWSCTLCQASEVVIDNGTSCGPCVVEEDNMYGWPSDARTVCVDLEPDRYRAWTTSIIVISLIGLIGTIVTFAVYVINKEKSLIKASSRELSYIIFSGLFLAYLTAVFYGAPPSKGICALRRLCSPLAISLIYVSIATRTVRVYRIFRAGLKSAKRPRYISPSSQVTLSLIICIVPVIWITVWLILIPPAVVNSMPDRNVPKIELMCEESDIEIIGNLSWEICLIVICCVFAFVTRKLPENYNESRFITFCAFSSLVVFASFVPALFTAREAIYKDVYNALGLFIKSTVTLMCLFVVKIYALYFVDERELNILTQSRTRSNTRTNSMINVTTSEGTGPPISPTRTVPPSNPTRTDPPASAARVGPHVNRAFDVTDPPDNSGNGTNVPSINQNNNNNIRRAPLQPVMRNPIDDPKKTNIDKDVSVISGKNVVEGGRLGMTSGSLMAKLRGNSSRVGDIGQGLTDGTNTTSGVQSNDHSQGDLSGDRAVGSRRNRHMNGIDSDGSLGSLGDDERVLLKVKRPHTGSMA